MPQIIARAWYGSSSFQPSIIEDEKEAAALIEAKHSAFFAGPALKPTLYYRSKSDLLLRISRHRSLAKSCEIKFRAHFWHEKVSAFWSVTITFKVALRDASYHEIIKTSISGKPETLTKAERQVQTDLLDKSIAAFFDRLDQAPDLLAADRISAADAINLRERIIEQAKMLAGKKDKALEDQIDARDARHAMLNALPDGTPLKIRRSSFARNWQLGVKQGNLTKAQAPHACLLRPADFTSSELRQSPISSHQLLPFMAAAQTAEAQADPSLFDFFRPGRKSVISLALDEKMPLHQSFRETEEFKARRKAAPKIWMQTGFSGATHGYQAEVGGKLQVFSPSDPLGRRTHPSLDGDDAYRLTAIKANPRTSPAPLADFCLPAGIFVVSGEIADLIGSHEIGKSTLEPIDIRDKDGMPIAGTWHHLVIREHVSAVMAPQCHPELMNSLRARTIKPYEIRVDPTAPGALDIWIDPQVKPQGIFLSGRLYNALKKAKALPPLTMKPCETA